MSDEPNVIETSVPDVTDTSGDETGFSLSEHFDEIPTQTGSDISTVDGGKEEASTKPEEKVKEKQAEPVAMISKEKHEKDLFKQRDGRRKAEAKTLEDAKTILALQERLGESPEVASSQLSEVQQAIIMERMRLSKESFLSNPKRGATLLEEKITGDNAPWKEIDELAISGDHKALQLQMRVQAASDPFGEALDILSEREIFEKFGTHSISTIIEKSLADQEEAMELRILAKLQPNRPDVGVLPTTLGSVNGQTDTKEKDEANEKSFSVAGYFGT